MAPGSPNAPHTHTCRSIETIPVGVTCCALGRAVRRRPGLALHAGRAVATSLLIYMNRHGRCYHFALSFTGIPHRKADRSEAQQQDRPRLIIRDHAGRILRGGGGGLQQAEEREERRSGGRGRRGRQQGREAPDAACRRSRRRPSGPAARPPAPRSPPAAHVPPSR
jgi:hypothetical protein